MKKFLRSEIEEMDIYELLEAIDFDMTKLMNEDDYDELIIQEIGNHNYDTAKDLLENVGSEYYLYDVDIDGTPEPIEDMIDLEFYLKRNHYIEIEEDI